MSEHRPLVEGITAAIVGAAEFGPHLEFHRDRPGYAVAPEGTVPAAVADHPRGKATKVSSGGTGSVSTACPP